MVSVFKNRVQRVLGLFCVWLQANAIAESPNWLTIYSYPPQKILNWSTPSTLLKDNVAAIVDGALTASGSTKSATGHTVAQLDCVDSKGKEQKFWSGMSGQNFFSDDWKSLMHKKVGFEILFKGYRDGLVKFEDYEKNRIINYAGEKKSEPRFLRFEISKEQCRFLGEMHNEFVRRSYYGQMPLKEWENKPDHELLQYGLPIVDPLKNYLKFRAGDKFAALGGGCTGYATSFIRAVGRWSDIFENLWKRSFTVSHKLIGTAERPVSVRELLLAHQWTFPHWKNREGWVFDPEHIWRFIGDSMQCDLRKDAHCSREVSTWLDSHHANLKSFDTITLNGYRDRIVKEGTSRSPVYVKRRFAASRKISGITITGVAQSPWKAAR